MQQGFHNLKQAFSRIEDLKVYDSLAVVREKAVRRLEGASYPTRQDEEWKYTSLSSIGKTEFDLMIQGDILDPSSQLVQDLVDDQNFLTVVYQGSSFVLSEELSSLVNEAKEGGLTVLSLASAAEKGLINAESFAAIPRGRFESVFHSLSDALLSEGVFVRVASGFKVPKPIRLVRLAEGVDRGGFRPIRHVIQVGKLAEAEIIDEACGFVEGENTVFENQVCEIEVSQGAKVKLSASYDLPQSYSHLSSVRVSVDRDGEFFHFGGQLAGGLLRQDIHAYLIGENASTELRGIYLGKGSSYVDTHVNVFHKVPHTRSVQHYKGVLTGSSRGVFNGKIIVERDAQKTDASQLNKNLLVGENAEVDTKPELWIDADDVKAAHGATVGQLNEDELFYLQSRGLSNEVAKKILLKAFVDEVVYEAETPEEGRLLKRVEEILAN